MAKNSEVMARVRVTVGGIAATKKNLKSLEESSAALKKQIDSLQEEKVRLFDAGETKKASEIVKQIDGLKTSLKAVNGMIQLQRTEIGNYENILDNLTGRTLHELKKGLTDLQQQMKFTLTQNDIDKYGELKNAYDQVLDAINQLSGKAPNLNYVLANLGKASDKSLRDSAEYVRKLIAETDKGSTRLLGLQQKLATLEWAQKDRLSKAADAAMGKVDGVSFSGTEAEAKQALETLREYKATLNMDTEAAKIQKVKEAMDAYEQALGKVKDKAVDVAAVLGNPKSFSIDVIEKAIKQLEEDGKKIKIGDTEAIEQNIADIERLKAVLADSVQSQSFIDNVVKDAKEGKASIADMEKAIAMAKEKLRHSKDATVTEKLRQDLDRLNPALELTKTSITRVTATLGNIKNANLGSLKEAAERLKVELNDVNIEMDEFNKKAAQLKQVNAQIKQLESQTKNVASAWDNAVSRLKNWVLIYAGSAEIWNQVQNAYRGALQLSDSMSDVRKTTGLTADEVVRLTDEVQELDSRINNEKLMQAAVEAGRIGLKTRQEVFEFTKASAITLTALDELDARAITSVMKLNQLLGETERLGVQQAILNTASSINELSMASSAAQQPIIDFSRRFGGIAAQAKISTAQVLGLGATIDALGQPIEMSSTALNKFTTALLSNGKAIAEDTGLSEDYIFEMTRQGQTIELMIEVLSKLNTMGGIGEISKYMGDMGGDGARMTAVISALAANLDLLTDNLKLSKMSFEEGISVINEYNLKNENAAALVERIGNDLKEMFVNSKFVEILTAALRPLQAFVSFMKEGSFTANMLKAALVMWGGKMLMLNKTVVQLLGSMGKAITSTFSWTNMLGKLWDALTVTQIKVGDFFAKVAEAKRAAGMVSALGVAFKGLGAAIKAAFITNPIGWISTIVMGLGWLIDAFKDTEDEVKQTTSAIERANQAFEEEDYKLTKLSEKLKNASAEKDNMNQRAKDMSSIVQTLNREYTNEIGYVIDLTASELELAKAIDIVRVAKRKQALELEKDRVSQDVREEYRDRTVSASNSLKTALNEGFKTVFVGGVSYQFTDKGLTDLYNTMMSEYIESANLEGAAKLGERTDEVLRTQAKALADGNTELETSLYNTWNEKLRLMYASKAVQDLYTAQAKEITEREGDIDRYIVAEGKRGIKLLQESVDIREAESLLLKEAKDFNAKDETVLTGVINSYEGIKKSIGKRENDPKRWDDVAAKVEEFKMKQNDVLRAYVENPLRGIKMKVGDDGKLYKELDKNGHMQYVAVSKLADANLNILAQNYVRADETFQKLLADRNGQMDATVIEQGNKLSKVRTAIKNFLNKNGIEIDEKGNMKPRSTEFRDGSERASRQEDSEGKKAYEALLNNLKEYYEKRKQVVLENFINEKTTVETKNRQLEEVDRQHNEARMAMISEILGEADPSIFDEDTLIRDKENWAKVLAWILKDTHHFQDTIRADRERLERENLDSMVKYKEERERILLGNDYQRQVDQEMQAAFEKADLFWVGEKTADNSKMILSELREASKLVYEEDAKTFRSRLEENAVFGEMMASLNAEQYAAFLILLQQYHDKVIEADKKFADEREKQSKHLWKSRGYDNQYYNAEQSITHRKEMVDTKEGFGAVSERKAFKERQDLILEEWALEEWRLQVQYQLALEAGETEEQLLARRLERAEIEKEMQRAITETYLEEYDRRVEKASEHAQEFGKFAGVMASFAWNSVEDRKKAGEELLTYIAQETSEYIRELVVRNIKEKLLQKQGLIDLKKGQEEKNKEEQKGVDTSLKITEIGGKLKTAVEEHVASDVTNIAASSAAENASLAVKKAQVDNAAGIASGAAKTIGELGWWGIPLIAVIEGVLSMLLNMATGALSNAFGKSESSKTTKRLATGMLTYAEGRYPALGDDGVTYNAQYEPALQTKVYDGGKGKAHMAIFSEVMPEMVVSGPTTKIIQEDYPALMNAILMIDKYGALPHPKRMRTYASGNLGEVADDVVMGADGTYAESPAISELRQSNAELRNTVAHLATILERGIHANINMYGTGGIKESMDKANKFYNKNRIKNS